MSDEDLPFIEGTDDQPVKRVKRKARHRGSVEPLPSGAVRVRIRDITLPDGRRIDLARTITADFGRNAAERKEEAKRRVLPAMVKQAMDLESGIAAFDAAITLAECVQRLRAAKSLRFAWRKADDSLWARCRPLWNLPLASIDVPRMRSMVVRWTEDGYAPVYVRAIGSLVRRILGRAAEQGWLARVPVWPVGLLPSKASGRRGMGAKLTGDQKQAVFVAAESRDRERAGDLATRLAWQLDLGLRPIECAWARVTDLIEDEAGAWWFHPSRAKGSGLKADEGVDRIPVSAPLAERVMRAFDALPLKAQAIGWLFPLKGQRGTWGPRFQEQGGHRRAHAWVTEAEVEDIRARSGVPFYPYQLRHTRAHELLTAGLTAAELQRFGAWRSPEVVQGYAGMVRELPAAVMTPSAPTPTPGALRAVAAPTSSSAARPARFITGRNLHETMGPDIGAANEAPAVPSVNRVGANVGPGGRGRAVGSERTSADLSELGGWLDDAASYSTPRAAVGVWHRRHGLPEIRRRASVVAAAERTGSVPGREGAVRALALALAARVAERGPKKAPEATEKANNLRAVGRLGDSHAG